jgi:hypothetical protein
MQPRSLIFTTAFLLSTALLLPSQSSAGITFTKVADTTTLIPDGTGSFTSLLDPSIDDGRVVFVGSGASGQTGIYEYYNGQLSMRVNQSTPIPGGTGSFTKFDIPSLDGADIAFQAEGPSKQGGVYMQYDGSLVKIADKNTQVPGTKSNFNFIMPEIAFEHGSTTLSDGAVTFRSQSGIYLASESGIAAIATRTPDIPTKIPDQPYNFNVFSFDGAATFSNGQVLLTGRYVDFGTDFFTDGVFLWDNATGLKKVIDQHSILPGHTAPIGHFMSTLYLDGGIPYVNVVSSVGLSIAALSLGNITWEGVFRVDAGGLTPVVTREDLQPAFDNRGPIVFFDSAFQDGRLAFPDIEGGMRIFENGELSTIVAAGGLIDGKIVDRARGSSRRDFLSGNQVALTLEFTDGSSGLYIATIPEPSTLVMAATALVGLGLALRRRLRIGRGSAAL